MFRLSIALLLCVVAGSTAISLPFEARPRTLQLVNQSLKDASDTFNFSNLNDVFYQATLTAGGAEFQVQLDTGSSDLWLDTANRHPLGTQDTGAVTAVIYGDGTVAQGPVLIANVTLGEFTVPQAFISAPGSNATHNIDTGLLGVGPPKLSHVEFALQSAFGFNGATFLENIFAANPGEPNFITFQLSRSETLGTTSGGTFSIGELNSTLSGISSAPKLDIVTVDRWITFMDGITVNGKNITGNSQFNMVGQGPTQTLANLDTGTSFAFIPRVYADAIYSSVPGAYFDSTDNEYVVPCDTKINLSFVFGGIPYPVHPIDTVQALTATKGGVICIGAFKVFPGGDSNEDFLLGDSFLRNVYSLFDFGSFVSGTTPPFIQLLSTTDASTANSEFDALSAQRNSSITGKVGNGSGHRSGAPRSMSRFSTMMLFQVIGLGMGIALS